MSIDGMFNILDIDEKVTVGNGEKMVATKLEVSGVASFKLTVQLWTL
jgi:hypothetical protein